MMTVPPFFFDNPLFSFQFCLFYMKYLLYTVVMKKNSLSR